MVGKIRLSALWVLLLLCCSVTVNAATCNTLIAEVDRVDCHAEPDATEDKCRCKGCRWCETTTSNIPYCFHETAPDTAAQVALRAVCPQCSDCMDRIDCHPQPLANEDTCLARGCLWCPYATPGQPWCFYGGSFTIETLRQMCPTCASCTSTGKNCLPGDDSPSEEECNGKGCLWCSSGSPQCIFGGNTTAPARYRTNCASCSACTMKYDCYPEPDATQAKCEARDCIWCETDKSSGEPWCLYGGSVEANCTSCSNCNTRINCHTEPYATKWSCEDRGCIWCPTDAKGVPYCIYPTVYT